MVLLLLGLCFLFLDGDRRYSAQDFIFLMFVVSLPECYYILRELKRRAKSRNVEGFEERRQLDNVIDQRTRAVAIDPLKGGRSETNTGASVRALVAPCCSSLSSSPHSWGGGVGERMTHYLGICEFNQSVVAL